MDDASIMLKKLKVFDPEGAVFDVEIDETTNEVRKWEMVKDA